MKKFVAFTLSLLFCTSIIIAHVEKKRCEICSGSGTVACLTCGGRGTTYRTTKDGKKQSIRCNTCNGTGRRTCTACGGQGWEFVNVTQNYAPLPSPPSHEPQKHNCTACNGRGTVQCPSCRNSSYGAGKQMCSACFGMGYKIINILTAEKETCTVCNGTGAKPCAKCNGSARVDCQACNGVGYFEER